MLKRLAVVISILFWFGCSDDPAEKTVPRISAVEGYAFGGILEDKDSSVREISCKFLTENDTLEIKTAISSSRIWQISIIVPEVPGDKDPVESLRDAAAKKYALNFNGKNKIEVQGVRVELLRDFERGERGVRCTFTDLEMKKIADQEAATAESKLKIAIRQAKEDILNLEYAVNSFRDETGVYPADWQWLISAPQVKNWQGPYIKEVPVDPWGRKYCYERTAQGYIIYSLGADGKSRLIP